MERQENAVHVRDRPEAFDESRRESFKGLGRDSSLRSGKSVDHWNDIVPGLLRALDETSRFGVADRPQFERRFEVGALPETEIG
jgi:hypothetical protein